MSAVSSVTVEATINTLNGVIVIGTLLGNGTTDAGGDTLVESDFGVRHFDHVQLGPVPVIDVHAVYHPSTHKVQWFLEDAGGIQIETLDNDANTTPFMVYGTV